MNRLFGKLFSQPEPEKPPLTPEQAGIFSALEGVGLRAVADEVARAAQPSIRLIDQPPTVSALPIGTCRLGGLPDLPPEMPWPVWKGVPMSFVCQLNLAEFAYLDLEHVLPAAGVLWFFYDARQEVYGADPSDRGGWQVTFYNGNLARLQPGQFPDGLPEGARFKPAALTFDREMTVPLAPGNAAQGTAWPPDTIHRYEDWLFNRFTPQQRSVPHHRIFGYPDEIQDDMQLQSALVSQGFTSQDDPAAAQAVQTRGDWRLLLQIDSDPASGMRWGSAGRIFYWIESAPLKELQFENTWLVMQSD